MLYLEPIPITCPGVRHAPFIAQPVRESRPMHATLTTGTLVTVLGGLIAQAVPQAPPSVSWACVALSAVGAVTLGLRLLHQYAMARLDIDRTKGENAALRAEVATYREARPK